MNCKYPECKNVVSPERVKNRARYCCTSCQKKHHYSQRENRVCKKLGCKSWFNVEKGSERIYCWSCDPAKKKEKDAPKSAIRKPESYCFDISISAPGNRFNDHRATHCSTESIVKGNMINCNNYCSCSDMSFAGWKEKALAGGCWEDPQAPIHNTRGGSPCTAVCQGFDFNL